jgi:hypothetical protein
MKKIIFISSLIFCSVSFGQVHKHAIGIRSSRFYRPYPFAFNYQYGLNDKWRLNTELFIHGARFLNSPYIHGKFNLDIQRVWNIKGGLNTYAGFGTTYSALHLSNSVPNAWYQYIGLGPQIGLEYDFNQHNIPLIFGIDHRVHIGRQFGYSPSWGIAGETGLSLKFTIN